ncbi:MULTISPECIES: hypothetical protein [Clostridium]|uniref:hypothetical protein n=1 Tax=Clostridium TaxID=1485 RepID=UPI000B2D0550|nr:MULTISPECIES: hypothetical protein [Clostridium]PJI08239.1 hypothetical protein CUB90_10355 [Clostridium sp. CT7]
MIVEGDNCKHCDELKSGKCKGEAEDCMCRKCPRNLGQCMITRYCRETESVIL